MFLLLRKRIHGIHAGSLLKGVAAALFAALVMTAALLGWTRLMGSHSPALVTLGGVLAGGVIYALVLIALRIPEIGSVVLLIKRRFS
jgi:predicted exporter